MYNPRWPHTFTILEESLDENGLPVTNNDGKAVTSAKEIAVVVYDPQWNPVKNTDGSFQAKAMTKVP